MSAFKRNDGLKVTYCCVYNLFKHLSDMNFRMFVVFVGLLWDCFDNPNEMLSIISLVIFCLPSSVRI